jgi:hypothetical protein
LKTIFKKQNLVITSFFSFLARDNLSHTKQKYHKTVDEQVNLALRWGIGDAIGNQSAATTKIWNDTMKVPIPIMLL